MTEASKRIIDRAPATYRKEFSDSQIDAHLEAIQTLSRERPYVLLTSALEKRSAEVTIIGADRPGLFSLITGVLASCGFSITGGQVYTLNTASEGKTDDAAHSAESSPPNRRRRRFGGGRGSGRFVGVPGSPISFQSAGESRRNESESAPAHEKVIVDRFVGTIEAAGEKRSGKGEEEFERTLRRRLDALFGALADEGTEAARKLVAEEVAGHIAAMPPGEGTALAPISIEEDLENEEATRFSVSTADTPFFLYSLSNALSLHEVSIDRVTIETTDNEVRDVFDVVGARGTPIRDREQLERIRLSILLTKQFTFVLDRAPDPYEAMKRFDRLIQDLGETPDSEDLRRLFSDRDLQRELAVVLGASDFVWEDFVRQQREQLVPMLEQIEGHKLLSFDESEVEQQLREALDNDAPVDERVDALNAFKDRQSFLIDLDHMLASDIDFFFLSRRLTALADAVVRTALDLAWEQETAKYGTPRTAAGIAARYAAFGLGKLGGSALGYASDIELLFIYNDSGDTDGGAEGESSARSVQNSEFFEQLFRSATSFIRARREGIFQTDLRLRPHGEDGPLACKLERFLEYYTADGPAHSAERLALIRLRQIGGDPELGTRVIRIRDDILYQRDSVSVPALRTLRRTQIDEKIDGDTRVNAKFSPGGLVDLEYNVQILQISHGRSNPALRCPGIHDALAALRDEGTIGDEETEAMVGAYRFLRRLINGLRMLRGNAQDLFMPPYESAECAHLARRIGYRRGHDLLESQQLKLDFETHTAVVRGFVERHLGADAIPGEVEGGPADLVLSPALARTRRDAILARIGIENCDRAAANIAAILSATEDPTRFSRVLILAWDPLSRVADADIALNNWERFVRSCPSPSGHLTDILEQPERLEILFTIFSSSQFLSDTLVASTDVFAWITSRETVERTYRARDLAVELQREWRSVRKESRDQWLSAVRRFRKRHILRIGTRDICLGEALPVITTEISSLAHAIVHVTLEAIWARKLGRAPGQANADSYAHYPARARSLALFAFGKLGGRELNYSSDIDLLAVYEPSQDDGTSRPGEQAAYTEIVRQLVRDLSEFTADGLCYRVDMRLRPHGISGSLVLPVERALTYYRTDAALWEKQALLKLSRLAGSRPLARHFTDNLRKLFDTPASAHEVRSSIAYLRRLAVEQSDSASRIGAAAANTAPGTRGDMPLAGTDIKNGEGGIRDIEFAVQGLQLSFAHENKSVISGNTLSAIETLQTLDLIGAETAQQLTDDYILMRKVEHFLQLYGDRQLHTIPFESTARERLAATAGGEPPADFFEHLNKAMHRSREFYRNVVETEE